VVRDGALTADKAGQLKYLEAVCKETLRLMPPTGGGFRIMDTTEKARSLILMLINLHAH
jgi:cytochrome P450